MTIELILNMPTTNWAKNLTYSVPVQQIENISQLQQLVRDSKGVKIVASGHSFNDIANSTNTLISLHNHNRILEIDTENYTVTIESGTRYGELATALHEAGFALHNLASLPHISVVGACATGTHGSGMDNGNLATAISEIQFIDGHGEIVRMARQSHPDTFDGAIVSLGALGIVTQLTLDIEPTYDVRQTVFLNMAFDDYINNFEDIMSAGYSVSAFTRWNSDKIDQVWVKQRGNELPITELSGAQLAVHNSHPILGVSPENCTPQLGELGAWHDRLPHFKMEFTPSDGDELQSEYFVDHQYAAQALKALQSISKDISSVLLVSEVRCIASDDMWLSPCYQQDSVAFHFTWKQDWQAVRTVLQKIEAALEPYSPRPHMGKLFTMSSAKIQSRYPKFAAFKTLVKAHDPNAKFRNRFLNVLLNES